MIYCDILIYHVVLLMYCDTLFIVHGSGYGGKTPVAPFGITVPYTREDD